MEDLIRHENQEINKRLYVLINQRLATTYGAVQGGHAVAEFLLKHPEQQWNNQYLIYLRANTDFWAGKFDELGIEYTAFCEPDFNNTITAIAVQEDTGLLFAGLDIWG